MVTSSLFNGHIQNAFVTGVNFKNANVNVRSAFSIRPEQQMQCNELARQHGFTDFVVLSTCNRTEIYGVGDVDVAGSIIARVCGQNVALYDDYKFIKTSEAALEHIFKVASGLDSQILGDYEILGQFRNACKLSKDNDLLGPFFERMANTCIQASKEIKTRTAISKGTVSASYAVIEVIQERFGDQALNILQIGTGKFGNSIAKNIAHYLPHVSLTLSNRTVSKAEETAETLGFSVLPYSSVAEAAGQFDVIVICANTDGYLMQPEYFTGSKTRLILDLTVPQSVHPEVSSNTGIEVLDIDNISSILEASIEHRKIYLPTAKEIIHHHIAVFHDWYKLYKQRNHILELKELLAAESLRCPYLSRLDEPTRKQRVNQALQAFVKTIKENPEVSIDIQQTIAGFKASNNQFEKSN